MNKQDAGNEPHYPHSHHHHHHQSLSSVATSSRLSSRQIESIAGLCAGFTTTIITHPLDIIKIRLQLSHASKESHSNKTIQTNKRPFQSVFNVIRQINQDATLSSMPYYLKLGTRKHFPLGINYLVQYYRGLSPNLIGNISAWGCYFALYAEFKNHIHTPNLTLNYFASSSLAGVVTSILTNPIWVLKTRIIAKPTNEQGAYKSLFDGIRTMVHNEGIGSFWKGSIPSMFQVLQASLQITIYDHLKNYIFKHRVVNGEQTTPTNTTNTTTTTTTTTTAATATATATATAPRHLSTTQYLYTSALSKIISTLVMYPTQVVKSRLQNSQKSHTSIMQVIQTLYFNEGGITAFYKGLSANIIRVVPATCITFVVYEHVKRILIE
ncbi:FLX1 [Candida margitis]|uniref:FLX1 n=1 Tax=Candida margitis TaxID=1775924 RepID=UPI0022266CDD|nr:FLX1 [Candida margitis]KAI5970730.1 FLX1 [Candida margitis]